MYIIFKEQKLEKYSGFLRVICLENEHPWWNMILWTTSLTSTWPKVYSKISWHKVTMTFSQELIWGRETCYTNIDWFLDLFWRWEVKIRSLRNDADFIAFSLGYTSYQADYGAA